MAPCGRNIIIYVMVFDAPSFQKSAHQRRPSKAGSRKPKAASRKPEACTTPLRPTACQGGEGHAVARGDCRRHAGSRQPTAESPKPAAAGYWLPAVGCQPQFLLSTYAWVRVFQSFHKAVNHSSQLIQPLIDFICPLFAHIASTGCNIYLRLQFI